MLYFDPLTRFIIYSEKISKQQVQHCEIRKLGKLCNLAAENIDFKNKIWLNSLSEAMNACSTFQRNISGDGKDLKHLT